MIATQVDFLDALQDSSAGNTKIPQSEFHAQGSLAIVDQGKMLIAGYTNDRSLEVKGDGPAIVFGDHTRSLKYVDFPFAMGADGVKVLRVRDGFDPKYVFRFLEARMVPSVGYSRHFKFLKNLRVPKPPLDEQRRIAAVLDHADALRAKRRQVLAHLDSLTKSIFHDMFGPAGSHISGAQVALLRDVLSVKSGSFLPATAQEHGPYPVFGGNGVNGHHSKYLFDEPKVVIGRVGAYCGAVHLAPARSWITDNAMYVTSKDHEISLPYLRDCLGNANLNQFASQSGQPLISASRIENVPIFVPTSEAQGTYEDTCTAVDALANSVQLALSADDELFASLQSRAFSGQL